MAIHKPRHDVYILPLAIKYAIALPILPIYLQKPSIRTRKGLGINFNLSTRLNLRSIHQPLRAICSENVHGDTPQRYDV